MAKIKVEEVLDHLGSELTAALRVALNQVGASSDVDAGQLFRAFKSAAYRQCRTWETVPDHYVEKG